MKPTLLGGLSPARFLSRHWQKKPLLVRGAFQHFGTTLEPFKPRDVLALARRDDTESRLVRHAGRKWALEHGPFDAAQLKSLGSRDWTILVQDTQHFSRAAESLLGHFDFIPHVRVDDLMVSLAAPGGGVGPHVDSYDVFLIQGKGRRRWRISSQRDLTLRPDMPLKILARFKADEEWVLESGDMLYLPPGYAHEGVALDECLTYSVGFRAPTHQEWIEYFLDQLRDNLQVHGQYGDPSLRPVTAPGQLPPDLVARFADTLKAIRWTRREIEGAVGSFLTDPKPHVVFEPPQVGLSLKQFQRAASRRGLSLDGRSRMSYSATRIFANGVSHPLPASGRALLRKLADTRHLAPSPLPDALIPLLHEWFEAGYLHIDHD